MLLNKVTLPKPASIANERRLIWSVFPKSLHVTSAIEDPKGGGAGIP
jgi:hypothetical protein